MSQGITGGRNNGASQNQLNLVHNQSKCYKIWSEILVRVITNAGKVPRLQIFESEVVMHPVPQLQ